MYNCSLFRTFSNGGTNNWMNNPVVSEVTSFFNSILRVYKLKAEQLFEGMNNESKMTSMKPCNNIWIRWLNTLIIRSEPDSYCRVCKTTEHVELCVGCKIRGYCSEQHRVSDRWKHESECSEFQDLETLRDYFTQHFLHTIQIPDNNTHTDTLHNISAKQLTKESVHQLHKWMEQVITKVKNKSSLITQLKGTELFIKSEQVMQKLQAFCSLCLQPEETDILPQPLSTVISNEKLPITGTLPFEQAFNALFDDLKGRCGMDCTKGVKSVLDAFVKQRYSYMGTTLSTSLLPQTGSNSCLARSYDLLPKSRIYCHLGRNWNFDASRLYLRGKRYIAHRFPRPNELKEFWKLLKAEKVEVIVQLNDASEGGNYWKLHTHSDMSVSIIDEYHEIVEPHSIEYITIRKLEIEIDKESSEKFRVTQISYRGWKDALVPMELEVFKKFLDLVEVHRGAQKDSASPVAVHCMAGWGRTGVFIMIDAIRHSIRSITNEDKSNSNTDIIKGDVIARTWKKMLAQRELIQNPLQLAFCIGYLETGEQFEPRHVVQLNQIVLSWFKLVGSVLLCNSDPSYESIANILKNDEGSSAHHHKSGNQNWWKLFKDLHPHLDDPALFIYLIRLPKRCLIWMVQHQAPLFTLLELHPVDQMKASHPRNALQLLFDENYVSIVEDALRSSVSSSPSTSPSSSLDTSQSPVSTCT